MKCDMYKYFIVAILIAAGNNLVASYPTLSIPLHPQDPLKEKKEAILFFLDELQLYLKVFTKTGDFLDVKETLNHSFIFYVLRPGNILLTKENDDLQQPFVDPHTRHQIISFILSVPQTLPATEEYKSLLIVLRDIFVIQIQDPSTPYILDRIATCVRKSTQEPGNILIPVTLSRELNLPPRYAVSLPID
jgi:hypothetical protein